MCLWIMCVCVCVLKSEIEKNWNLKSVILEKNYMLQKIRFFSYIINYFYENIRVKRSVKRSEKLLQYVFNAKRTSVVRIRT